MKMYEVRSSDVLEVAIPGEVWGYSFFDKSWKELEVGEIHNSFAVVDNLPQNIVKSLQEPFSLWKDTLPDYCHVYTEPHAGNKIGICLTISVVRSTTPQFERPINWLS